MLANSKRSDEQVVLLNIARHGRDLLDHVDETSVHAYLAAHVQLTSIAQVERIQQSRFAASTCAQYCQDLVRSRQSTNLKN